MVNYRFMGASYQLVAGVNILLNYIGIDDYSQIQAIVSFDLKENPLITSFKVECQNKQSICTHQVVWEYFSSV